MRTPGLTSESAMFIHFARHSFGAFHGMRPWSASSRERSESFAVFSNHVRYLYGSSPFSSAVWIILNITALPEAPFGMLANRKFFRSITKGLMLLSARWHGRKFCVSVIRQNQEYHVINVHDGGLIPLVNVLPAGWRYARRVRRECRHNLSGMLFQGDQPTLRSANMISS